MMVYAIVLARYLGPEDYGYYVTGYALVGLWSFIISSGMDTWLLRASKTSEQTKLLSGEILKIKVLILFIWAPFLIVGINRVSFVASEFIIICVLDIWCDSMLITLIYGLNIQQNYYKVSGILTSSRLGRLISALILIGLGVRNPMLFAVCRLFFTTFGFLMALVSLKPIININKIEGVKISLKELVPFGLSEMFAQIYIMADVSLLALLAGKVQVGLYSPATNILSAMFVIPNSLYLYIVPKFSRKISIQEQIPNKEVVISVIGFGLVGLILFGSIAISAEWIIPIVLGKVFDQTKQFLLQLSPIIVFKSLQFGLIAIIVSSGLQKLRLIPQFISAMINVGMNVILIPKFGAEGAVLVYNISEFFLLVGYGLIVLAQRKKWLVKWINQ